MADNKLNEIIRTALEKMQSMSDGNTVIGTPINTPGGTTIIPVSKVSLGLVSGGIDYFGKNQATATKAVSGNNFGGGGATGLTIAPVAFLVISPDGDVEMLNVNATPPPADPLSKVSGMLDSAPELIEKIKGLILSQKEKKQEASASEESAPEKTEKSE